MPTAYDVARYAAAQELFALAERQLVENRRHQSLPRIEVRPRVFAAGFPGAPTLLRFSDLESFGIVGTAGIHGLGVGVAHQEREPFRQPSREFKRGRIVVGVHDAHDHLAVAELRKGSTRENAACRAGLRIAEQDCALQVVALRAQVASF